jgi:CRP-like cAMP-binding protein
MIHAYKKNDILFREGDRSDFIYRLVSGEAEVTTLLKGGSEFAGRVLPGEFIGEIGVLVACRRGATAQFTSDSEVEELNCADFLALVASDRDVSVRLLNLLSLRTRSQVELLQALPDVEDVNAIRRRKPWRWCLFKVRAIFRPVHEWIRRKTNLNLLRQTRAAIARIDPAREYFAKGDFLFREGEESQRVFWIESGKVKISKSINQRDRVIGTAGANEYLGEMGVLESLPRNASVVAERGVVAYCLTPSQFFSLMQASPAAYSVVIK